MRERQHLCAVVADGPVILAYTLRWPYQLRDAADLDLPSEDLDDLAVTDQELKMAEQLVGAMVGEWRPEQYRDTYRDDVLRMIDEKVKGGKVTARRNPSARKARRWWTSWRSCGAASRRGSRPRREGPSQAAGAAGAGQRGGLGIPVALEEYRRKRDFEKTPEPAGGGGREPERPKRAQRERQSAGLLYVIQKHDASRLHYDFRLELDGVLLSWAIPEGPLARPSRPAPGGADRGPSSRVRELRGHHPRG